MARVGYKPGENDRFLTLTMPTLRGVKIDDALAVLYRAWRLFTKRKFWTELCRAGVKGVEFTLGDQQRLKDEGREWDIDRDGYHPHIHLLIRSKWVKRLTLMQEFTKALLKAFKEFGIEQPINTKDGLVLCDVRLAVNRKQRKKAKGAIISLNGAFNEVCKYITKCESWLKVPESQLVAIASVKRWPRMFELLKECRGGGQPASVDAAMVEQSNALDNTLSTSLDTRRLSAASNTRGSPPDQPEKRPPSLLDRGEALIKAGQREKWRKELFEHVWRTQSIRRSLLAGRFPVAQFSTLDGDSWCGVFCGLGDVVRGFGDVPEPKALSAWGRTLKTELARVDEEMKQWDSTQ